MFVVVAYLLCDRSGHLKRRLEEVGIITSLREEFSLNRLDHDIAVAILFAFADIAGDLDDPFSTNILNADDLELRLFGVDISRSAVEKEGIDTKTGKRFRRELAGIFRSPSLDRVKISAGKRRGKILSRDRLPACRAGIDFLVVVRFEDNLLAGRQCRELLEPRLRSPCRPDRR